MPVLSLGLVVAAVMGAFVAGGSLDRGFPVEVAIVRGVLGFVVVAVVGYLGELVVVTAPPRQREAQQLTDHAAKQVAAPAAPEQAAAPRPVVAARSVDDEDNSDDADVELRPAA